jgi:hypothetical protein
VSITWSYVGRPSSSIPLVGYAELERDEETNDLRIPIRILRGPDACVQRLRQRFAMVLGEWFLDQRLGVPYREQLLVKNPDKGLVTSLFRRVILDTPGFARVVSLNCSVDKASRTMTTTFEAVLEDPNVIVRAVDAPFKLR